MGCASGLIAPSIGMVNLLASDSSGPCRDRPVLGRTQVKITAGNSRWRFFEFFLEDSQLNVYAGGSRCAHRLRPPKPASGGSAIVGSIPVWVTSLRSPVRRGLPAGVAAKRRVGGPFRRRREGGVGAADGSGDLSRLPSTRRSMAARRRSTWAGSAGYGSRRAFSLVLGRCCRFRA